MKCTAKLVYYKKSTKLNKKRLYCSIPYNWSLMSWWDSLPTKTQDKLNFESIVECGGKIVAQISSHYEPEEYSELEVNFICEICGQYYHPNLPREETSLNKWLTDIIAQLDTPDIS